MGSDAVRAWVQQLAGRGHDADGRLPEPPGLSGALVDDSGSFATTAAGVAYYDLVTIGHRTLENWQDTVH